MLGASIDTASPVLVLRAWTSSMHVSCIVDSSVYQRAWMHIKPHACSARCVDPRLMVGRSSCIAHLDEQHGLLYASARMQLAVLAVRTSATWAWQSHSAGH